MSEQIVMDGLDEIIEVGENAVNLQICRLLLSQFVLQKRGKEVWFGLTLIELMTNQACGKAPGKSGRGKNIDGQTNRIKTERKFN